MAEELYAVRRSDGEPIGEYTFCVVDSSDWTPAELDADDLDEPIEYELVKMTIEVVDRRTLPLCRMCYEAPATHWGLCEQHAREDDPEAFD